MTKSEFLSALEARLSGLPEEDKRESLEYYAEMIDDRIEDGIPEEEAVNAIGSVDSVVSEILSNVPLTKIVKEKVKPSRKIGAWEIVLLVLGSPLWLSLVLALAAVVLSCYLVLWSVVLTFYAVTLSLGVGGLAGIAVMILFGVRGELTAGLLMLGAGLVCAGLAILFFHLSNLVARGVIALSRVMAAGMKRLFAGKEAAK